MDWAALVTAVTAEIGDVFTAIVPVVAMLVAASVGYGLFRRFVG